MNQPLVAFTIGGLLVIVLIIALGVLAFNARNMNHDIAITKIAFENGYEQQVYGLDNHLRWVKVECKKCKGKDFVLVASAAELMK